MAIFYRGLGQAVIYTSIHCTVLLPIHFYQEKRTGAGKCIIISKKQTSVNACKQTDILPQEQNILKWQDWERI